ncbi:ABC transporter permease [Pontibacillus litoralis]|uniref:ABC transporter permease n=1 Tax=Pontibacillus litoralis JSM 072002 TaxID=1385512 RepID=A0A0A5HSX0_9BACI|nr:iron ABC transporter permease [Pontibacillus litoralis]KGX86742.1 ABC transporter permease [Pontibacillus litoralis JSM 072002]
MLSQTKRGQNKLPSSHFMNRILKYIGIVLLVIFFVIPIFRLFMLSFQTDQGFQLTHYVEMLQREETWNVLQNTLYVVGGATILSIIIGVGMAWLVAYSDIRMKNGMQILIIMPFIIPSYIVTLSWTQFFAPNAWFSSLLQSIAIETWDLYSLSGMVFVMGLSHYPLVYLLTVRMFRKVPRDLEMASRISGAGRLKTFFTVTAPIALPGIASGGLLAFLASLDNFGIPAFLGIPANINVLSTYIYEQVVGFGPSAFAKAATLSVLLGMLALIGTFIQWLLVRKSKSLETVNEDFQARFSLGKYRGVIEVCVWSLLVFTSVVPLLSMISTSFIKAYGLDFTWDNLTLDHYRFVLMESGKTQQAITNSIMLGFGTMLICLICGTAIAYFRVRKPTKWLKAIEVIIGLPYALPGIVLALAMIFAWMEPIPGWNPGIYGSMKILFIAYVTRFLILQIRGSITAIMQVDPSMEEAAHVSGASNMVKWKSILLPLIMPGVLSGSFLVLLQALTELTVSSLLWSAGSETIGLVIFNFEQAGYTTYSTAFSSLIVLLIAVGILLLYGIKNVGKVRRGKS